jgi:carboxymethylenebutenolidase
MEPSTMGKQTELTASDGHKFSAYVAEPAGKPKGALIVVMEIFGVNSHIRRVTDEYAGDGYLAIAPAFFDRAQKGLDVGYTGQDLELARSLMQKMNLNDPLKDVEAAKAHVQSAGTSDTAGAVRSRSSRRAT